VSTRGRCNAIAPETNILGVTEFNSLDYVARKGIYGFADLTSEFAEDDRRFKQRYPKTAALFFRVWTDKVHKA
jgi:hypothetical protein